MLGATTVSSFGSNFPVGRNKSFQEVDVLVANALNVLRAEVAFSLLKTIVVVVHNSTY